MNADIHSALSHYEACPVCLGTERFLLPQEEDSSNPYLDVLSEYLKEDLTGLLAEMLTYKCSHCGTIYCDPWLNIKTSSKMYGAVFGQHRYGWNNFYQWIRNRKSCSPPNMKKDMIWRRLQEVAGPIEMYGELNCAFSGLLLEFAHLRADTDPGYRGAIAQHTLSMRNSYHNEAFTGYAETPPPPPHIEDIPDDFHLVVERSSLCWGDNCVHQSTSCHAIAAAMFHVNILSLGEVEHLNLDFDVLGAWHIHDHCFQPMEIIDRLASRAKLVVLLSHGTRTVMQKQHFYQFGDEFPDYLREQGFSVLELPTEDFAEDPDDPNNSQLVFVSKRMDLGAVS